MLNMSATFNCVDHSILLHHLQVGVSITGIVLNWITSFLTGHTQQVVYNSQLSVTQIVVWSAPRFGSWSAAVCTLHCRTV